MKKNLLKYRRIWYEFVHFSDRIFEIESFSFCNESFTIGFITFNFVIINKTAKNKRVFFIWNFFKREMIFYSQFLRTEKQNAAFFSRCFTHFRWCFDNLFNESCLKFAKNKDNILYNYPSRPIWWIPHSSPKNRNFPFLDYSKLYFVAN